MSRPVRDYCRLHRDQHELGGKSSIVSGVGAWRLPHASSVNGDYIPRGRLRHRFRRAFGNLSRSSSAQKHVRIVLAMEAREGLNTENRVEHCTAVRDHLFEDMTATSHPLRVSGEIAGLSSNTL